MNALETAREMGYAIRVCSSASRHKAHTYERKYLDADGTWNPYRAWCLGKVSHDS